jgi:capsular exopolysaccharide synthesis family protein
VQVVDLAAAAGAPVGTRRSLKLMLGLMLGLMMGTGAAFLKEHLNTAIRADEIESVLGIPSLVLIPQFAKRGARRWGARRGANPASGQEGEELRELVALTAPHSAGAEAFRTLRTNLLFSQAERSLRSLVVTSTSPAEGKTTVSANLGLAFAQQGLRVLLVDGDLRRPRLHEPFQLSREPGLTDLAMGYRTREEVIRPAAGVEGLFLLPAGTLPPNPSEFVGSPRMRAVLSDLGESFDLLLVDTPPVQAAADAAILASMADGVMLVLRAGKTGRNAAQFAVREVARLGGRLLGVVVNDPDAQMQHSEAYYGYSYGYGKQDDRSSARMRAGAQGR